MTDVIAVFTVAFVLVALGTIRNRLMPRVSLAWLVVLVVGWAIGQVLAGVNCPNAIIHITAGWTFAVIFGGRDE